MKREFIDQLNAADEVQRLHECYRLIQRTYETHAFSSNDLYANRDYYLVRSTAEKLRVRYIDLINDQLNNNNSHE